MNIFIPSDFEFIRHRVEKLTPASIRLWGVMDIQQMLAHCIAQLQLALGEVPSQRQGNFILRTAIGKWIALSGIPWAKGSATPMEMNILKRKDKLLPVEIEKKELIMYLNRIVGTHHLTEHPFFGKLTWKQWGRLIYKHLDHHLKQFSQ